MHTPEHRTAKMQGYKAVFIWCFLGLSSALIQPKPGHLKWWSECGLSKYPDAGETNAYIAKGEDARPYEFPWQGSFRQKPGAPENQWCGVVVIHPDWVVTAAHCTYLRDPEDYVVVLGEHEPWEPSSVRQVFQPTLFINHPDYNREEWYDCDISLIRLNTSVTFSEDIFPVCPPPDYNEDYEAWDSIISGFGSVTAGVLELPEVLQWVRLPVTNQFDCAEDLERYGVVTDNMICAGRIPNNDGDACQADSGGPMTVKREGIFEVVGLVSWGVGCASGYPGVYTRVTEFVDWVEETIESNPM